MSHDLNLLRGRTRRCTSAVIGIVALLPVLSAMPASGQETAAEAIAVLQSDAGEYDKAMACRLLSQIGDPASVDALAPLVSDPRFATYARTALEQIPGPEADRALRHAAASLDGDLLVGVLDSIGRRRDARAIELLAERLTSEDRQTGAAAARALGRIGTAESAARLQPAFEQATDESRAAVAWALLDCSSSLQRQGSKAEASAICRAVRQSDVSRPIVLAATLQLAELDDAQAPTLLDELLTSDDDGDFRAGLQLARQLPNTAASALAARYSEAPPARQVLLLAALGDLADPAAIPVLKAASTARDASVRRQAMISLAGFDTASAAAILLSGMVDQDPDVAAAAQVSLGEVEHPDVDRAILDVLHDPSSAALPAAIEVARTRQTPSSAAPLLAIIQKARPEIRDAAILALGATVQLDQLPQLLQLALEGEGSQQEAAERALATACARLPREECAAALTDAMDGAAVENQVMLLEQLTVLGGDNALEAVATAARSDRDALQDAATRVLGEWPNSAAAPALLALARELEEPKYRIRALRGYVRIARQLDMSLAERMEVCRQALQAAERPQEKQLVLDVLRRYPDPAGMDVAATLLDDATLGGEALAVLVTVAPAVIQDQAGEAVKVLERAIETAPREQQAQLAAVLTTARASTEQNAAQADGEESGFTRLFDGRTLQGWHGNREIFRVENGQIVGGSLQEPIPRNEFLRTDEEFEDFELRLEFKLAGERPNAGVQFRTQEIPGDHEVSGYQADLGPGWWGCLYDESRRRRILAGPPEGERGEPVRENEWNDYRIRAEGPRIQLWINGVQTVDYTEPDPEIPRSGIIALQVHSGPPMEARYRNLRIKELGDEKPSP